MAVVNTNSDLIANAVATPRVPNAAGLDGAMVRSKQALVAVANGDSVGSTYRMFRLPSGAYLRDIDLNTADIGTTTIADIGLYYPTTHANGGTVIDVDAFASAVSLKDGAVALTTSQRFEAAAAAGLYTNYNKRLWEQAGLTSDPGGEFDVVLTLTGAADATGTVLARCLFTV